MLTLDVLNLILLMVNAFHANNQELHSNTVFAAQVDNLIVYYLKAAFQ